MTLAHDLGVVGVQHSRFYTVAEGVARYVGGCQFQGLDHARYVAGQGVKRNSFLWAGTLPSPSEIDPNRTVAGLGHYIRQPFHVANVQAPTGQQNDCFSFALAEVLDVCVAEFDDAGLHVGSGLFGDRLRGSACVCRPGTADSFFRVPFGLLCREVVHQSFDDIEIGFGAQQNDGPHTADAQRLHDAEHEQEHLGHLPFCPASERRMRVALPPRAANKGRSRNESRPFFSRSKFAFRTFRCRFGGVQTEKKRSASLPGLVTWG